MSEGKAGGVAFAPAALAVAGSTAAAPVLAAAVVVVAGAAVVVGAAAAAALITRAAMTGAVALSDKAEATAAEWKKEQQTAADWAEAVIGVSTRNARIHALRAALGKTRRGGKPGAGVDLPGPFSPAGRTIAEIAAWIAHADQRITRAEEALAEQNLAASLERLGRMAGGKSLVPVAAAIADRYALLAVDGATATAPRQAAGGPKPGTDDGDLDALKRRTADRIGRQLARLPHDVSDEGYATVLEAAAKASAAKTATEAEMWVQELHGRAKKVAAATERRRGEILTAGRYLSALRLEEIHVGLFPQQATAAWADVRRRLEAVQAGEGDLDDGLRHAAERAVRQAQRLADDAFVTAQIQVALGALGYQAVGQDRAAGAALTVSGPALGEVTAQIAISGGRLHARLRPGSAGVSADQVDRWRQDFSELQQALSGSGIRSEVTEARKSAAATQEDAKDEDTPTRAPAYRERRR
jgi:hypothetical protein